MTPTVLALVADDEMSYSTYTQRFGGVVRWVAAPGEEIWATAGTAPNGEMILDSIAGTGVVSQDIRFEEL